MYLISNIISFFAKYSNISIIYLLVIFTKAPSYPVRKLLKALVIAVDNFYYFLQ